MSDPSYPPPPPRDLTAAAEVVGNELLAALQVEAEALKDKLTEADRAILERATKRLAVLVAQRVRASDVEAAGIDGELGIVVATLANYRAVAALVIARASGRVAEAAGKILGRVARGLLAGALGVGL